MISLNCQVDFEADFWAGFDGAMGEEWGVNATTSCYQTDAFPSNIYDYKGLANRIVMQTAGASSEERHPVDFTTYIDSLLKQSTVDRQVVFLTEHSDAVFKSPAARGIAYPGENMAFVKNNFEYSTGTLSHEILHLVLEEQGYKKSCYVDKVHENQFAYAMKDMGAGRYPVVKKFGC